MSGEYHKIVGEAILDHQHLVRATFSGRQHGEALAWEKVTVRPIEVRGKTAVQFVYYDDKKCITKNFADAELAANLDTLLQLPFKNIQVSTAACEIHVNVGKSGKATVHRSARAARAIEAPGRTHDRQKDLLLPEGKPDAYLQAIGFMTGDGQIKADKQRKFRQINEFLKLLQQTGELEKFEKPVIDLVDYGCGNAYLTFGAYHYLNRILGRPARMVGVDLRGELLEKHAQTARELGWSDMTFERCAIADYVPAAPTDITLALHACDTATDEALAQGIRWESRLIISVPCCHHHLQDQMRRQQPPEAFRPVLRHGILAERQGDILTDSFRALILRIMGYRTEVLQFISAEHTAKNIMIRSVRSNLPPPTAFVAEYRQMKAYWNVTPWLETLLGEPFQRSLEQTRL
jgi:SAM-dependent methyltransferase